MWLNECLENGDWQAIKKYQRKKNTNTMTQLRNENNEPIPMEDNAKTMAEYYEKYKWHTRPDCSIHTTKKIFDTDLPLDENPITIKEMRNTITKLKNNRATGTDCVSAELWKIIASDDTAISFFMDFCNQCHSTS